jgi:hypothetical protein
LSTPLALTALLILYTQTNSAAAILDNSNLLGINSVLHSDFSAQPDVDFTNQQRVILDRLGCGDIGQVLPPFATPSPHNNSSNTANQQQQQQQQQQHQQQYTPHGSGGSSGSGSSSNTMNSNLGPVVPFHLTQRQAQQVSQQLAPSQFGNFNKRHGSQSSMTGSVTSAAGGSSKWDMWCSGGGEHSSSSSVMHSSSSSNTNSSNAAAAAAAAAASAPAYGKRPFEHVDEPFDED